MLQMFFFLTKYFLVNTILTLISDSYLPSCYTIQITCHRAIVICETLKLFDLAPIHYEMYLLPVFLNTFMTFIFFVYILIPCFFVLHQDSPSPSAVLSLGSS